jgi:hypothetical protein
MTRDVRGEIEGNRVELSNQENEITPFLLLLRASSGHVAAPPSCAMNFVFSFHSAACWQAVRPSHGHARH